MKKAGMGIGAVIVIIGLVYACAQFFSEGGSTYYYTQIDNSKMEEVDSRGGVIDVQGGMPYSYTLPAYKENGDGKDITFGASRELRELAFLRLTVSPVRGVIAWSEIQYEELPEAVQRIYGD